MLALFASFRYFSAATCSSPPPSKICRTRFSQLACLAVDDKEQEDHVPTGRRHPDRDQCLQAQRCESRSDQQQKSATTSSATEAGLKSKTAGSQVCQTTSSSSWRETTTSIEAKAKSTTETAIPSSPSSTCTKASDKTANSRTSKCETSSKTGTIQVERISTSRSIAPSQTSKATTAKTAT